MNSSNWPTYAGIMLLSGVGIPILAALNAGLGLRIGSAPAASVIGLTAALLFAVIATLISGMMPRDADWGNIPLQFYVGGVFMGFYLVAVTFIAPKFGVGNAVFFVLLGQIMSAAAIDHFGLFGAAKASIGGVRIFGIVLMMVGVFLARKKVGH
ncbi:MAG: DMT family transporter [Pseudomonadota bacterium]